MTELGAVPDAAIVGVDEARSVAREIVELVEGVSTALEAGMVVASEVRADEAISVAREIVELVEGVSTALEVEAVVASEVEEEVSEAPADEPEDAAPAELDGAAAELVGTTTTAGVDEPEEATSELVGTTTVGATVDDELVSVNSGGIEPELPALLAAESDGTLLEVSVSVVRVLSKDGNEASEDESDPRLLSRSVSDRLVCCVVDWMSKVTGWLGVDRGVEDEKVVVTLGNCLFTSRGK